MPRKTLLLALCLALVTAGAGAAEVLRERLTGNDDPMAETPAPKLPSRMTEGPRTMRNYPEQPPVIPHDIEGYEISLNTNKCLTCHRREHTQQTGAPMISITHYRDSDGQMLADVAPRRHFCTQCHVPQTEARPLIDNTFTDMSDLVGEGGE